MQIAVLCMYRGLVLFFLRNYRSLVYGEDVGQHSSREESDEEGDDRIVIGWNSVSNGFLVLRNFIWNENEHRFI